MKRLVYTSRIPVRWGDMDAFGHVNNTVYFRYMEQVRIEWMESFYNMQSLLETGPVLVSTQCNYLHPVKYPDQVEVQLYLGKVGRSSFETHYQMYRLDADRTLCADGSGTVVWVDRSTEKSIALPETVRAQFSAG